jgi:hypothetical protein
MVEDEQEDWYHWRVCRRSKFCVNTDVWLGGIWWGGGPWWNNYIYGMEPPSGSAYTAVLPLMLPLI